MFVPLQAPQVALAGAVAIAIWAEVIGCISIFSTFWSVRGVQHERPGILASLTLVALVQLWMLQRAIGLMLPLAGPVVRVQAKRTGIRLCMVGSMLMAMLPGSYIRDSARKCSVRQQHGSLKIVLLLCFYEVLWKF